jgi:hypothetical protein
MPSKTDLKLDIDSARSLIRLGGSGIHLNLIEVKQFIIFINFVNGVFFQIGKVQLKALKCKCSITRPSYSNFRVLKILQKSPSIEYSILDHGITR